MQHKLTLMRDKTTPTMAFRRLLNEIGMLICYEVTRDLALPEIEIETPMARMRAPAAVDERLNGGYIVPGLGDG